MNDFFRYPHTPHLAWLGSEEPREDKVLGIEEARELLAGEVVIEEKIDGANLGISLDAKGEIRLQNRGHYIEQPSSGQFSNLHRWLRNHADSLFDGLDLNLIAFGEWCAARHSMHYDRLPDWWILFDVYDRKQKKFWSSERRDAWAQQVGVVAAARTFKGRISRKEVIALLDTAGSAYCDAAPEGFVIRRENPEWLLSRAKIVRASFTQNIGEHWSRSHLRPNSLASRPD